MSRLEPHHIAEFAAHWDERTESPGPIDDFTYALVNVLQQPVVGAAAEVSRVASMYADLVINGGRPRSWEFEGVFMDIRAVLPDIPRPTIPEAGRPLTVDAAACMLTLAKSYRNTCIRICRAAISQSPWAPHTGANRSADPAFATLCCKLVEEVYEALGRSEMARPAIQVLLPYFSDARFVSALKEAMDEEAWTPVDDHLAVFDLLLDAHEQRGAGVPACRDRTFAPHTRLLDELTRREDYHPIMKGGSFFFFGERIDYGPSLRSYREAAESVLQPNKRPRIEQWLVLLELVSFAIDHGRNK